MTPNTKAIIQTGRPKPPALRSPAGRHVRTDHIAACLIIIAVTVVILPAGCRTVRTPTGAERRRASDEQHRQLFSDFQLPRKLGTVENTPLQLPVISPDGQHMLCLSTDQSYISPMTLLGSTDPKHTPPDEGTLCVYLRPLEGSDPGRRISRCRWAHSPVWSPSGSAVAYVAHKPPASQIIHLDLASGERTILGLADSTNCLPRFDGDDRTLLFCAKPCQANRFRVYRQTVGQPTPVALTNKAMDCLFPIVSDSRRGVFCAQRSPSGLGWVWATPDHVRLVMPRGGASDLLEAIQTWAGVADPLSPDGGKILFYHTEQQRICVCDIHSHSVRTHRSGSIAACWLTDHAIALATPESVFTVNTETGFSPHLLDGPWIPRRYVKETRRLILLGKERSRRLSIFEIIFRTPQQPTEKTEP